MSKCECGNEKPDDQPTCYDCYKKTWGKKSKVAVDVARPKKITYMPEAICEACE